MLFPAGAGAHGEAAARRLRKGAEGRQGGDLWILVSDLCSLIFDLCSLIFDLCILIFDLCILVFDLCSLTSDLRRKWWSGTMRSWRSRLASKPGSPTGSWTALLTYLFDGWRNLMVRSSTGEAREKLEKWSLDGAERLRKSSPLLPLWKSLPSFSSFSQRTHPE